MKSFRFILSFLFCFFITGVIIFSCFVYGCQPSRYSNPVIRRDFSDPSVIRVPDGTYYAYSSSDVVRSVDMVHWEYVGPTFTNRPDWGDAGANVWAPDVNYINGQYVMYYSLSVWGGMETCGVGRAVSNTPDGPFTDMGKLFISNEIGVRNSIDPDYLEDGDKKYLFWGSYGRGSGIWFVELTDDGLNLKYTGGSDKRQVASNGHEGAAMHKRGNYYYLFAARGTCCNGMESTYHTVVGRSSSVSGPYVNRAGQSMMNNYHELVIVGNDTFRGPGHSSKLVKDNAGNDWIFYHANCKDINGRPMMLDKIFWSEDGWPSVGTPSVEANAPVF